jgi:hypothetical protein
MAAPPKSWAASAEKSPWKLPMGVRAALTMTMGSDMVFSRKFKRKSTLDLRFSERNQAKDQ